MGMSNRPLITTDSHVAVPVSLADELPEEYRSKVGHLEQREDGVYFVRPEPLIRHVGGNDLGPNQPGGDLMAANNNLLTNTLADGIKIDPDDEDALARLEYANVTPEAKPGFTVERRLEQMAMDGVVGEVLVGPSGFGSVSDPEVDIVWAQIQNDWLADTFKDHLGTFAPGINLPLNAGPEACAKEVERAAALGMRPAVLPDAIVDKPYNHPMWEPLWEVANGLKIPIALHLTGVRGLAMPWRRILPVEEWGRGEHITGMMVLCAGVTESVSWFATGGVLEKYPDLNIVMTECQAGWLGWLMGFLDHFWGSRWSRATETGNMKAALGEKYPLTEATAQLLHQASGQVPRSPMTPPPSSCATSPVSTA